MTPKLQDFGVDGNFQGEELAGVGDISVAMATVLTGLETSLEGRFSDMNSGVLSAMRIASFKSWPSTQESSEGNNEENHCLSRQV